MSDVADRSKAEKTSAVYPEPGRSRVRADAKITLRLTRRFHNQQINQHLDAAVVDENSHVTPEPQRDDFPTCNAYETARLGYLPGRKVRPPE